MSELKNFFDRVDQLYEAVAGYPKELIEDILQDSDAMERHIMSYWTVLPGLKTGSINQKTEQVAAAFTLINFTYQVHGNVGEDDSAADKVNVLIGDLLFAASYRFLEESCTPEELEQCAKISIARSEAWFGWHALPLAKRNDVALTLPLIEKEYGIYFREVAELGCSAASLDGEARRQYIDLVTDAAIVWGAKKRHCTLTWEDYRERLQTRAEELSLTDEISWFMQIFNA